MIGEFSVVQNVKTLAVGYVDKMLLSEQDQFLRALRYCTKSDIS